MAYTPHTWQCEELVTPEKLNHIEQGIADCCGGGGQLISTVLSEAPAQDCPDGSYLTFDKTWQEMYDAIDAGIPVFIKMTDNLGISFGLVTSITFGEHNLSISTAIVPYVITFETPTSDTGLMCPLA